MEIKLGNGMTLFRADGLDYICIDSSGVKFCNFSHTIDYINSVNWTKRVLEYAPLKAFLAWDTERHCWYDD